ncbi:eCIS core domain-containing protein [Streptomyces prunicolor]|uniref:eCIS core domain-containing protein n=1 Tax=Streptomyces prunicolor TaxID=67348 RepID=UPI003431D14F
MRYDDKARTSPQSPARTPLKPVPSRTPAAAGLSGDLMALQRSIGNAAVVQLLAAQRAEEEHQHGEGCGHQPVQRSAAEAVLRSAGRPLESAKRTEMEARLGADFSEVKVHTDAVAQRSTAELGARAWTSGNHVVIGKDGGDDHTLAHELTHVIQQRSGPVDGTAGGDGLKVSDPSDRFEKAAEANAARAMSQPAPAVQRATPQETTRSSGAETSVQRARYATSKTQRDPDSDNYDSDDDNFDTLISQLTPPTDYSTVASMVAEGSEHGVYLWRGTSLATANSMASRGSAGGRTADPSVSAPSSASSRSQVGHGGQLPEFTTGTGVAEGFSFRNALVVVYVAAKYLSKGSSSEEGWIADPKAPLTVVDIVDRTRQQGSGRRGANAS